MHAALLLAAAALSVDYGWQPLDDGGFEYIIQIEPELLDSLRDGYALASHLPPSLRNVRSYRIICGREPVPRLGNPQAEQAAAEPVRTQPSPDPVSNAWPRDRSETELPPMRRPSDDRYKGFGSPGDTPPRLQEHEPHTHTETEPPGHFHPASNSEALFKQTSGVQGAADTKTTLSAKSPAGAASEATNTDENRSRPWLPLTATLLCLFVSLGGNAYLGMNWWAIRARCQQLLRERRAGSARSSATKPPANGRATDDEEAESDEEDPPAVTTVAEEYPSHGKRRR